MISRSIGSTFFDAASRVISAAPTLLIDVEDDFAKLSDFETVMGTDHRRGTIFLDHHGTDAARVKRQMPPRQHRRVERLLKLREKHRPTDGRGIRGFDLA